MYIQNLTLSFKEYLTHVAHITKSNISWELWINQKNLFNLIHFSRSDHDAVSNVYNRNDFLRKLLK